MKLAMKAEIRDAWLEALRSGHYKQGESYLRKGENFCCLGVLCDLAVEAGVGRWEHEEGDDVFAYNNGQFLTGSRNALPPQVLAWAGLSRAFGAIGDLGTDIGWFQHNGARYKANTLTAANDGMKFDFNKIADIIEQHIEPRIEE